MKHWRVKKRFAWKRIKGVVVFIGAKKYVHKTLWLQSYYTIEYMWQTLAGIGWSDDHRAKYKEKEAAQEVCDYLEEHRDPMDNRKADIVQNELINQYIEQYGK